MAATFWLGRTAPAQAALGMWCSLTDSSQNRVYLSDVQTFQTLSKIRLWAYSARFQQAVDATSAEHFAGESQACRIFASIERARTARAALIGDLRGTRTDMVVVGVF